MIALGCFDFVSKVPGILSFKKQDLISLSPNTSIKNKWVSGTNIRTNEKGVFPPNYVQFLDEKQFNNFSKKQLVGSETKKKRKKPSFHINTFRLSRTILRVDKDFSKLGGSRLRSDTNVKTITKNVLRLRTLRVPNSVPFYPFFREGKFRVSERNGKWENRYLLLYGTKLYFWKTAKQFQGLDNSHLSIDLIDLLRIEKRELENESNSNSNNNNFKKQKSIMLITKNLKITFLVAKNNEEQNDWYSNLKTIKIFYMLMKKKKIKDLDEKLYYKCLNFLYYNQEYLTKYLDQISTIILDENSKNSNNSKTEINKNNKLIKMKRNLLMNCLQSINNCIDFFLFKVMILNYKVKSDFRQKCLVLKDYKKANNLEISLKKYQLISIVQANQNGMWLGEFNFKMGLFPTKNCELIQIDSLDIFSDDFEKKYLSIENQLFILFRNHGNNLKNDNKNENNNGNNKNNNDNNDNNKKNNDNNNNNKNNNNNSNKDNDNEDNNYINENDNFEDFNILDNLSIIFKSYLNKQLQSKKSKWKKRFFLLVNNYFAYYTNEYHTKPNLILDLRKIKGVTNASMKLKKELCFEVQNPIRELRLNTNDTNLFNRWIEILQLCLNFLNYKNKIQMQNEEIEKKKVSLENLIQYLDELLKYYQERYFKIIQKKKKQQNKNKNFSLFIYSNQNDNNENSEKRNKKDNKNCFLFYPFLKLLQKKIYIMNKINIINKYKLKFLGILARLEFPNLLDKEIAYSIKDHTSLILFEEFKFEKKQWLYLINEVDDVYLLVENKEHTDIGLAFRSKLLIINIRDSKKIFFELENDLKIIKNDNLLINKDNKNEDDDEVDNENDNDKNKDVGGMKNKDKEIIILHNDDDDDEKDEKNANQNQNKNQNKNQNDTKVNDNDNINKNIQKQDQKQEPEPEQVQEQEEKQEQTQEQEQKQEKEKEQKQKQNIIINKNHKRTSSLKQIKKYQSELLNNEIEFEKKSGECFPIEKKGYLKIYKKGKFQKKYFSLTSWYFGYYDNINSKKTLGIIDFRKVICFKQDFKKESHTFNLRIKGGLTQILQCKSQIELDSWFNIFKYCLLFIKLSKLRLPNPFGNENGNGNENENENENKNKNENENENENINKNENESGSDNENNNFSINESGNKNIKKNQNNFEIDKINDNFIELIDWIDLTKGKLNNIQNKTRDLISQLALLKTWKKKLFSKFARLNIKDPNDNRIRLYCIKDYKASITESEMLSIKKGDWLILINNEENENNNNKNNLLIEVEFNNKRGGINKNHVQIIKPSGYEEIFTNNSGDHDDNDDDDDDNNDNFNLYYSKDDFNLQLEDELNYTFTFNYTFANNNTINNDNDKNSNKKNNSNNNNNNNNNSGSSSSSSSSSSINENNTNNTDINNSKNKNPKNIHEIQKKEIDEIIQNDKLKDVIFKQSNNKIKNYLIKNINFRRYGDFRDALPLFFSSSIKKQNKNGVGKWKNKILVIMDWFLLIFNNKLNSCEQLFNLHQLISVERCIDLEEYEYSFILYIGKEEVRIVVDNIHLFEKWLNKLNILKNFLIILSPFEKQNNIFIKYKYLKLVKWFELQIKIQSLINLKLIENNYDLKQNYEQLLYKIKASIKLLQQWREYILSRYCKYCILNLNFFSNKFDNSLIEDQKERIICLCDYSSNNNEELNFKENEIYLLQNKAHAHLKVIDKNDEIKKVYPDNVQIIKPEKINLKKEFPNLFQKKKNEKIDQFNDLHFQRGYNNDSSGNNNFNIISNLNKYNNNIFNSFLNDSDNNINNEDKNDNCDENDNNFELINKFNNNFLNLINSNKFNLNNLINQDIEDKIFYSNFNLNILKKKRANFLAQNCLNDFKNNPKSLFSFPIKYKNYLYSTADGSPYNNALSTKLIKYNAVLMSWILLLYKNSELNKNIYKVYDLRTIQSVEKKVLSIKEYSIILVFKEGFEKVFILQNEKQCDKWYYYFNSIMYFLIFLESNDNDSENDQDNIKKQGKSEVLNINNSKGKEQKIENENEKEKENEKENEREKEREREIEIEIINEDQIKMKNEIYIKNKNNNKNENEKEQLVLKNLKTFYNWIKNEINEQENLKDSHEQLIYLYKNSSDTTQEYNSQKEINSSQKRLISLYIWRKRILIDICKIENKAFLHDPNYDLIAFTLDSNNTKRQRQKTNNELMYSTNNWVIVKKLMDNKNKIFNESFLGILNNKEGFIKKSQVCFLSKIDFNINWDFEFSENVQKNIKLFQNEKLLNKTLKSEKYMNLKLKNYKDLMEFELIPLQKEGYLYYYQSSLLSSKWVKRHVLIKNDQLQFYINKNDLEPIKIVKLNNNLKLKKFIKNQKQIYDISSISTLSSLLNIESNIHYFELVNNHKNYKLICNNNDSKLEWIDYLKNIKNLLIIQRYPTKINYDEALRERRFLKAKLFIQHSIHQFQSKIKTFNSMFEFSSQNPNRNLQNRKELNQIKNAILELKELIRKYETFHLLILSKLLRFQLNKTAKNEVQENNGNTNDNKSKDESDDKWGYLTYTIQDPNKKNVIVKDQFIKLLEKVENTEKTKIVYNKKVIKIPNGSYIEISASKPQIFLEDFQTKKKRKEKKNPKLKLLNKNSNIFKSKFEIKMKKKLFNKNEKGKGKGTGKRNENGNESENGFTQPKKQLLLKLLVDEDLDLLKALVEIIDSPDADLLANCIILVLQSHEFVIPFIEHTINSEIEGIDDENTLFRGNSVAIKVMNNFARKISKNYFIKILSPIIEEIIQSTESFEIKMEQIINNNTNNEKEDNEKILIENQQRINYYCNKMINAILNSVYDFPLIIRDVCWRLCNVTNVKFPKAKYLVMAGFVFLRLISPVIVVPEMYGITELKANPKVRKALVIVSKVIQNIANSTKFKETSMKFMNPIITQYCEKIHTFMDDLIEPIFSTSSFDGKKLIIIGKSGQSFIAISANDLNSQPFQIAIDDLDLENTSISYKPESFPVSVDEIDIALSKIFKLINTSNYKKLLFQKLNSKEEILLKLKQITN
ncbi:ras gtpase-activating protein [Anaeramoeba flamelloides]|uniref:Ras gtpase-activating protein n=1 Tax=Anaeramoeba flamelloides TaxID=1746091 RepID=A0ABQ8ZG87_9EUKA|nr:ras gtpase-activating protein [Anaeramoeba flamelloides]